MCTVTHCRQTQRLLVTMNRDELRERAAEIPPAVHVSPAGVSWVAPRDGDRRGAWIAANDCGLAACLLNRYPARPVPEGRSSRGEIIPLLCGLGGFHQCVDWLAKDFDSGRYSPFTLILTSLCGSSAVFSWDGVQILRSRRALGDGWRCETSSSWKESEVAPFRRRAFRDWLRSGRPFNGSLPAFNVLSLPGKEAWSPLMSRPSSQTRSITQIEFDAVRCRVAMRYWPDPFERLDAPSCLTMPLRMDAIGRQAVQSPSLAT